MAHRIKLHWPVDDHTITQYFGENPQVYAEYHQAGHEGLDFSAPVGSNIYSCADGQVFQVHSNDGNAYGLHVRIQHQVNGSEYHTVYAHLSDVSVSEGHSVKTGEPIGQSGLTGHTFGPHLHLTLKLLGAETAGYPAGVVDPLPYFEEAESPAPSDLTVYTTERVRLRSRPTTDSIQLAWLVQGEALTVLGDATEARIKVGQTEQWIQVRRASGLDGFVAAWYTQLEPLTPSPPEPTPAGPLVVYATEALNVRRGASTGTSRIAIALPHEPMTVLDDREVAAGKVGDRGEWLAVRLPLGLEGHIAAWYVQTDPGPAPQSLVVVSPTEDMNMRERPSTQARKIGRPVEGTPLTVHDDPGRARALVGRYDEWLYVETPEGQRGWVAAWYVRIHTPSFEPSRALRRAVAGPLVLYATEALNVRRGPSTGTSRIAIALPHEPLTVIGDQEAALSRLGKHGEWLEVHLPDGRTGHVAAWYVRREPGPALESLVTVYPFVNLNLRQRPTVRATWVGQAPHGTPLTVHDDPGRARALVGRHDEWLYVETPGGQRGWVAAWYVSPAPT